MSRYRNLKELQNYYLRLKAHSVILKNLLFTVNKMSIYIPCKKIVTHVVTYKQIIN